ncbi:MAG: diguanylate cyclase [Clostridia bacterium]|nr:diguanylate cyclase [Clostridia bacterium]
MSLIESIKANQVTQDIRYKLFRTYLLISALLSIIIGFVHIINQRPIINVIFAFSGAIIVLVSYLYAKNPNRYLFSRLIFYIFFCYIITPIGYLTSPGSYSAMIYMIVLITFMTSVISVNKWEFIFPVSVILQVPILLRTEIWFPDLYYQYTDEVYRINDLTLNIIITLIAIASTVYYMIYNYKSHNDILYKISVTDSLTGLYNRHYFFDFAEMEYNRALRNNEEFSIIFVDLNNFKRINDSLGHQVGDQVLMEVASLIESDIRSYDIAARYGGDEFIIILPNTKSEDAKIMLERLKSSIFKYAEKYEKYHFSAGFGLATNENKTLDEIVTMADQRMYKDKLEQKKEHL